jgi:hypothetical protein
MKNQKMKNANNIMPIIIEFIVNTKFEIQMWIMKISCKLNTHKTKKHKILKALKIKELKMVKQK